MIAFFEAADAFLGGFDIAVINAAVPADALAETQESEMRYQVAADFTAYLSTAQEATNRMPRGSDIILIGSMSAVSPQRQQFHLRRRKIGNPRLRKVPNPAEPPYR
ncbi:MAG: hypothetical protein ABI668_12965 [Sphingorhabdus sp.]